MDVSIVMINYNTYELTKQAIDSVFRYTENVSFELILVDNNSPDGSGEQLEREFNGRIIYIQAGENAGTSKSFNRGAKRAKGTYVLWLNPDTMLKENFVGTLYDFMEKNPKCGVCGGNVLNFQGKPMHSFRRELPSLKTIKQDKSFFTVIWRKLFCKCLSEEYNYTGKPMEVGFITGADMMIRRNIFDAIGFFDEDIFMYAEEAEFTFRAKRRTGCKVYSVPDAHIYHLEGASFQAENAFSERRFRAMITGNAVYFRKCLGEAACMSFLKIEKRAYLKIMLCCFLTFQKNSFRIYKRKREIITEFLKIFPDFMNHDARENAAHTAEI